MGSTPTPTAGDDPAGRRDLSDEQALLGSIPRSPTGEYPLCLISSRKGNQVHAGSTPASPTPFAPDWTGTGLLNRTDIGFESLERHAALAQRIVAASFYLAGREFESLMLHTMPGSSSGPGRRPLKPVARVRIPLRARPHRLAAKDTALSRRRHGSESRWGYCSVGEPGRPRGPHKA